MTIEVFLVSGGVDSTIGSFLNPNAKPVFVDYGQQYSEIESNTASSIFGKKLNKIIINPSNNLPYETFIPCRNLMLSTLVATRYYPDVIWMAGLEDDNVVDKNIYAFADISNLISKYANKTIEVKSPFWEMTKGEIVEQFLNKNNNAKEILYKTVSCYSPQGNCGECDACFRKFVAFTSNFLECKRPAKHLCEKYLEKLHTYHPNRILRTLQAMKKVYNKVIAFDFDGTLYKSPQEKDIQATLKKSYDDGYCIIIYTSRPRSDRDFVLEEINKMELEYHALITDKIFYDQLYDDKAINML